MAKAAKAVETKAAKKAPKVEAKAEKAAGKKSAKLAAKATDAPENQPQVDQDELEEQQEAAEAAASSTGGGNAAAMAAAAGTTEMSASFKNFRHHPDMENFYRFIYENDLRHEALDIIDQIQNEKAARRAVKVAKAHAH